MLDRVPTASLPAATQAQAAAHAVQAPDIRAFTELMQDQAHPSLLGQAVKDLPRDMSQAYETIHAEWRQYGRLDPTDLTSAVKAIEIQASINSASLRFFGMTNMVKGVVDAFSKLINTTS